MRRHLTIKTRQYLTLGFVAVLLAAAAGVAMWHLNAIGRGAEAVQARAQAAGAIGTLAGEVGSLVEHERSYFLNLARLKSGDDDLSRWNDAYTRVAASLDAAESSVGERATAPARSALIAYQGEFKTLQGRLVVDGISKLDPTGADGEAMRAAFGQLENRTASLLKDANSQVAAETAGVEAAVGRTSTAISLTPRHAVLTIVGLTFLLYRRSLPKPAPLRGCASRSRSAT